MRRAAQAILFGALSANLANAFSPVFSEPRQCEAFRITWSALELPSTSTTVNEIALSLVPLDNDPSRVAPEPYQASVPAGGHSIPVLPFPAGTQFFATAYIPGAAGLVRRTVSKVFTVEHTANSDCLPKSAARADGRAKIKAFGKRQVSVVGTGLVDATNAGVPQNAAATPSTSGAAPPAISVVGVGAIPADQAASSGSPPSATSSSAAASASGSGAPPIIVVGTSQISATNAVVAPGNAAPQPSSSGPAPPIQVIGTSFVPAGGAPPQQSGSDASNSGSASPTATTTTDSSATTTQSSTSTSCTSEPTSADDSFDETVTVTMTVVVGSGDIAETSSTSSQTPTSTQSFDTVVVHYSSYDQMVNAANSMFKAWNPYPPSSTPSSS